MQHQYRHLVALAFWCAMAHPLQAQTAQELARPRIVVTADPELDDNNSLLRFLLYSSDMQVEGLIYASSQFHWKGDDKGTKALVPGRGKPVGQFWAALYWPQRGKQLTECSALHSSFFPERSAQPRSPAAPPCPSPW